MVQASGSGLAARRRWRSGDRGFSRRGLSLFARAYVVYNAARWLFTGDLSEAQWRPESIMRLKRELGLAVEAWCSTVSTIAASDRHRDWRRHHAADSSRPAPTRSRSRSGS
jgi:hypothetical protein